MARCRRQQRVRKREKVAASSHASRAFGVGPDARGSRVAPRRRSGDAADPESGARGSTPRRRRGGGGTSGSTERCWLLWGVPIRTIRVTRARVAAWTTRTGASLDAFARVSAVRVADADVRDARGEPRGRRRRRGGGRGGGARARARARIRHGGPARGRARRGLHGRAGVPVRPARGRARVDKRTGHGNAVRRAAVREPRGRVREGRRRDSRRRRRRRGGVSSARRADFRVRGDSASHERRASIDRRVGGRGRVDHRG